MLSLKEARHAGALVEAEFEELAALNDYACHRFQPGRNHAAQIMTPQGPITAPDVTLWRLNSSSVHEIKGKYPHLNGGFGLEDYRFKALIVMNSYAKAYYTIRVQPAIKEDQIERSKTLITRFCPDWMNRWVTAEIEKLEEHGGFDEGPMWSYYDGGWRLVTGRYWPMELWTPLRWPKVSTIGRRCPDCEYSMERIGLAEWFCRFCETIGSDICE